MRIVKSLTILLSALFMATMSMAQVTTGTITGYVKDIKGAGLTGAAVEVIHEPSGSKYRSVSTASGKFTVPGLRIGGPYKITFT